MRKPFLLLLILTLLLTALPATALADGYAQDEVTCKSVVTVQKNNG